MFPVLEASYVHSNFKGLNFVDLLSMKFSSFLYQNTFHKEDKVNLKQ